MSGTPNDPSLWDFVQQWKPGALGLIGLGAIQGLRMWWRDYRDGKDPVAKAERLDRAETKAWLSQQDRRVRAVVEQTNAENNRLRERVEELEKDLEASQTEVDSERTSGFGHYQGKIRMYNLIVQLILDWRSGKTPPEKIPEMDKI
jgi:hypothetical protein